MFLCPQDGPQIGCFLPCFGIDLGRITLEPDIYYAHLPGRKRSDRIDRPGQLDMQAALVSPRIWEPTLVALTGFAEGEMASIADWDAEVINAFLRREGFEIQLRP